MAIPAQRCAACCAAKGVLLREPLKPTQPAEPEQIVSPSGSVNVINVLLNVAFMYTIALATFFLTFRFTVVVGIIEKTLK
jgi:Fe-S-cluster containining protein